MNERELRKLVKELREGSVDEDAFVSRVKSAPFEDLGDVKLDRHRALRRGFSEIIYCPGKSDEQLETIARAVSDNEENILFSRISEAQCGIVRHFMEDLEYYPVPRLAGVRRSPSDDIWKGLTVVAAGSSDVPVAEEAAITAEYANCEVTRLYDVGVAGIHRLLCHLDILQKSRAIVAVAGMEGALPGVVAGLVSCPVVAVPTSIGYGANFGGLSALLTMINSCATGVGVMNIDNGIGAGIFAAMIVRQSI